MFVLLMKWVSSVGDEHIRVTSSLLSPGHFLRLSLVLEREAPGLAEVARSTLKDSSLGFSAYNVAMTTSKVI